MSEPSVSIIVPVYNDAASVGRALESCLAQTLADVEVVVVDDASTDATPAVVAGFAERDERVRVVRHEENRQLLEARRTGVGLARAPYAAFLDADDWLDADFAERALAQAREQGADVVCFPIVCEYPEGGRPSPEVERGRAAMYAAPDLVAQGPDVVHATYRDDKVVWSLCGKLYATACLREAFGRIPARRMFQCEDAYTYFLVAHAANRLVAVSDAPAYRYSMGTGDTRADSSSLSAREYARLCRGAEAAEGVRDFLATCADADMYADDVAQLRFRLLADVTTRFPRDVAPQVRPLALRSLVGSWPYAEALGWLAARQWEDPAPCVLAAAHADLPVRERRGAPAVGVLWGSVHDAPARMRDLVRVLAEDCGLSVTVFADEDVDMPVLAAGVTCVRLPSAERVTGGRYPQRARALGAGLEQAGVDVLVVCQWLRVCLPWDALVARCAGARLVLAPQDVPTTFELREFPEQRGLPEVCALADAVVCPEGDAVFWQPFGACVTELAAGATVGDEALWGPLLADLGQGRPAPAAVSGAYALWDGVLSAQARRSRVERSIAEAATDARGRADALEAELARARADLESSRSELADVRGSVSFKVGRIITAPLRALRDGAASARKRLH